MPRELPPHLETTPLSHRKLEKLKRRDGRVQLGTLGRGNHFLEFQADQDGNLWLMVHSGSRAMGQAIANHHGDCGSRSQSGFAFLDSATEEGRAYLADAAWAAQYAAENRIQMSVTQH